jgi:hypothetical protein
MLVKVSNFINDILKSFRDENTGQNLQESNPVNIRNSLTLINMQNIMKRVEIMRDEYSPRDLRFKEVK